MTMSSTTIAPSSTRSSPHPISLSNLLPPLPNHIRNNPMILMLLQPTHHHNRHHPLHAPHLNRHPAPVNSIPPRLLPIHAELLPERLLIPLILALQEPRAAPPPQHGIPLPPHPLLVVRRRAGAHRALEDDLLGVGERDGDEGGFLGGEGEEAGAEEGAEVVGVVDGEGGEGEGVGVCLEGFELIGSFREFSSVDSSGCELTSLGGGGMGPWVRRDSGVWSC